MPDFAAQRGTMVERQLAARGIADSRVIEAMRMVPREEFVPAQLREFAYEDSALPIECGQTISQPYIVALMIEAAALGATDKVLEIGAGSGYAAAVMGQVARSVIAMERHAVLAALARARMEELGRANVSIRDGDGTRGLVAEAPFDAIIASASGPDVPDVLLRQLAVGGRLVMPVGGQHSVQTLLKVTRTAEEGFEQEDLGAVRFVSLIGAHGWTQD